MYEETGDFPEAALQPIREARAAILAALERIPQEAGWRHPFLVVKGDPSVREGGVAHGSSNAFRAKSGEHA
ncbi:MAG: hypothetical protein RIS00_1509 [Pseudomonadota bacterium]|jgi:hypothetical protein